VPYEAAGVIGTLGGLAEIVKSVFGEGGPGTAGARTTQQARRPGIVPTSGHGS
jgi:hypothetical protein